MGSFGRRPISRRMVIQAALGGVATSLLAACSPGAPPPPSKPAESKPAESKPAEAAKPAQQAPAATQPVAAAAKPGEASAPKPTEAAKPAADAKPAGQPKKGGKLVMAQVGDNSNLEPFVQQPTATIYLTNLFSTPVRYDTEIKANPQLAESWQVAQDGRSITLKVRPGVKFSNGKEVTSEDFNFSVERAKDPKVGSLFRPQAMLVTKTEAPDKSTAIWRFDAPFPAIVDLLARQFIVSKETIDLDNWKQRLIGTGPFTWEEWQPGERALWKRNANYYETDLPYLDEVEVRSFGDANTMAANLESGQVDVIARLPMTEVARLKSNSNLKVFQAPVRLFYDVLLQSISAPFENKLLRQAINWGIDRERFVRTTLVGLASATSQPLPSHSWAWFPELDKTYSFNLDKAKELMTQAGYPNGLEVQCLTCTARQKELTALAQIMAADLEKIGIKLKIEDVEPAVYDKRHLAGEFQMAIHNYGRANLDPSTLFRGAAAWHAGTGMTKFDAPEYRKLMEDAEASYDQNERKPKYKAMIQYIQDQSFVIPVSPNPEFYIMRSRVQGFTTDGESNVSLRQVWVDG
ncbi:MAG: ABC transporter substrate-binding protein [Chloroflexi bacterium]|nr:ABC transporter substrate-binding protein [Chloroflexota bacterium]